MSNSNDQNTKNRTPIWIGIAILIVAVVIGGVVVNGKIKDSNRKRVEQAVLNSGKPQTSAKSATNTKSITSKKDTSNTESTREYEELGKEDIKLTDSATMILIVGKNEKNYDLSAQIAASDFQEISGAYSALVAQVSTDPYFDSLVVTGKIDDISVFYVNYDSEKDAVTMMSGRDTLQDEYEAKSPVWLQNNDAINPDNILLYSDSLLNATEAYNSIVTKYCK